MILYPYGTLVIGATAACAMIGNSKREDGKFNGKASTIAGVATTASSVLSDVIMETHYHNLVGKVETETTEAYVQQLSDEELETALMQFDLLEKEETNDVKVL